MVYSVGNLLKVSYGEYSNYTNTAVHQHLVYIVQPLSI